MQGSSDDVYLADHIIALASPDTDEPVGGADARFKSVDQVEYSIGKTAGHDNTSDVVSFACPAKSASNQAPTTRDRASAEPTTRS
jgi:hypothetical protein